MDDSDKLRANARLVVEELGPLSGIDFGFDRESVKWLEGYIERLRLSGEFRNTEAGRKFASVFGSYLGECVIHCHGGAWTLRDGVWCVAFDKRNAVFPVNKVAKQIDAGIEEGIDSFFASIPIMFPAQGDASRAAPRRPWWNIFGS